MQEITVPETTDSTHTSITSFNFHDGLRAVVPLEGKMKLTRLIFTGLIAAVSLSAVGVALAGPVGNAIDAGQNASPRVALRDIGALSVFDKSPEFTEAESASLARLSQQLKSTKYPGMAGRADLTSARPFATSQGDFVWVTKTSDGGICEFIPQLAAGLSAGFSSSCSTLGDFNQNGLATVVRGKGDTFLVVAVQSADVPPPAVLMPDGRTRTLPVQSNVTVAEVERGASVKSGGATLSTESLADSSEARR